MTVRILAAFALTFLAGFAVAPAADEKADVKKELEKLAGTWKVLAVESNGLKAEGDELKDLRYVFKKDGTWELQKDGQVQAYGTYSLDTSKQPPTIDYKIVESISETSKGKTSLGIYELDGDSLRVCRSWPDKDERPTDFSAGPDSKNILGEYQRVKP